MTTFCFVSPLETYVDEHGSVSGTQVPQDGRIVEEGQVGHVFGLLELRRVHFLELILLQGLDDALAEGDLRLVTLHRLDDTLDVALLRIWDPHILLRVVGLRLILKKPVI